MANTVTENGGDPADQSALDLIELLSGNPRSSLFPLPGDDERFHIVGGNDQLVSRDDRPAARGDRPARSCARRRAANADRTIRLSFDVAGRTVDVSADLRRARAAVQHAARRRPVATPGCRRPSARDPRRWGWAPTPRSTSSSAHKTWPALGYQRRHLRRMAAPRLRVGRLRPARPRRQPGAVPGVPRGRRRAHRAHRRRPRPGAGRRRRLGARGRSSTSSQARPPPTPAAPTRITGRSTRGCRAPTPTTGSARPPATGSSPAPPRDASCSRRAHLDRQHRLPRRRGRNRRAGRAAAASADRRLTQARRRHVAGMSPGTSPARRRHVAGGRRCSRHRLRVLTVAARKVLPRLGVFVSNRPPDGPL